MKYLWKSLLIIILLTGCTQHQATSETPSETIQITDSYGGTEGYRTVDVEQYPLLYRTTVISLIIIDFIIGKKNKIPTAIVDHFENYTLCWLSLGILIAAVFMASTYDTDAYYQATFAGFALFLTPYYLYSQYSEAKPQHMTKKLWLRIVLLLLIDIIVLFKISSDIALVVILLQCLCVMLLEHKQFQNSLV